ncbi:MAG: response regulator [Abitibacteriaceae bacterium]|nr:response regulator [Abditibacteriaceae bacterium]
MNNLREPLKPVTILLADDSEDDRLMTREALAESFVLNELREVEDGEELMDYLHRRGAYTDAASSPRPGLILLDLNMPRKSGHEALREIRADPILRRIPVVVLTTSREEADILHSYDLGVSSFISKPVTFAGLVDVMKTFGKYWIEICAIPPIAEDV